MKCLTVPVLAFADFKKPFLLETDASIEGLGAVLSQDQDGGHYHPVAYASCGLKGGELKYHSSKLEFLAWKWAITKQFREYLQYQPFLIRTDNNPLTYVLMMPNLDAIRHRWVAAMAGYNFEIQYVCGSDNKVANALSCTLEGIWMRTMSRNCLTRAPSKSCSVTPCIMACHRQSLMTLG